MDGIVPLWKEKGMTSFDCVFQVRKLLQTKKVGHSGTLDPEVDGVLPICVGKATKVVEYLLESNKVYEGEITLGFSTETEDAHGAVVQKKAVEKLVTMEDIDKAMNEMTGVLLQTPPMYSAVKVNGKRLYEYARKGEIIERPSRPVEIFSFNRTSEPVWNQETRTQSWKFSVSCSKGTYVRTLAVDLGEKLGFPSHMSQLTRVKSGSFTKEECVTLTELQQAVEAGTVDLLLQPLERAFQHYPILSVDEQLASRIKNGAVLLQKELPTVKQPTCLYSKGKLLALYGPHPEKAGLLKPIKMF